MSQRYDKTKIIKTGVPALVSIRNLEIETTLKVYLPGIEYENHMPKGATEFMQQNQQLVTRSPPTLKCPSQYRLRYFDIRGLGEPIRMMFHYYGVPFEDIRISQEEWPFLKNSTRIGKLPELEVDGLHLAQSMTIARFLAEKFEIYADMDVEAAAWQRARIDEIADTQKDLTHELAVYIGTALGMRDGKKSVLKKKVYTPTVAKYFSFYVRLLDESRSGFLAGSVPTWIDFFVEEYLTTLTNVDTTALKDHTQLIDFVHQVRNLPQLADYIEHRKETII